MLDTVCVKYKKALEDKELIGWEEQINKPSNGAFYRRYFLNTTLENGAVVSYKYLPSCLKKFPLLLVEFSLPHVAFGSNIFSPLNLKQTIELAQSNINHSQLLPEIDLWAGIVHRLDIFYNHQVGKYLPYYLTALRSLEYPRRKTKPYLYEGVAYPCGDSISRFYDKQRECKDIRAKGILRQESELKSRSIKLLTGRKQPTFRDITPDLLANTLITDLERLTLLNRQIPSESVALSQLCKLFGVTKGLVQFGLLSARKLEVTKEQIALATGLSTKTVYRRLKKMDLEDLPQTCSSCEDSLPPLKIDISIAQKFCSDTICPECLSDTPQTNDTS